MLVVLFVVVRVGDCSEDLVSCWQRKVSSSGVSLQCEDILVL